MRTFGTAILRGDSWEIVADPHVAMRMKRLFKRSDRGNPGKLKLSNTPENCRDLEWFCSRYPLAVTPPAALEAGARQHRDLILRLEEYMAPGYEARPFDLALPPRSYQSRAAEVCLAQGYLLVADDVGLGKTASAICMLADPRTRPAVVVTLTHLPPQWAREVRKFAPQLHVHVVKRATAYKLPDFFGQAPDVIILSYSKLAGWAQVLASLARSVVFDEIQELRRGDGSQKGAAAAVIAERCGFRMGLSATPIYNWGDEIFNVLHLLKPGILGAHDEFIREWCVPIKGKYRIKEPRAFGTWARESFAMLRHTRQEVGRELPEVVKVTQIVNSDQRELERVESDATALARFILSGAQEQEKGERWRAAEELSWKLRQATGIAKAPYVADFVRLVVESGERVVLCGWHRAVYDLWRERLKDLRVALYSGSESPKQKDEIARRFQAGELDVLILSLRSGAGLDGLQESSNVIVFGELDWSPGVHEQCIGRIHRDGQHRGVMAYFLVAEDGADPVIAETLGLKRDQVEGIRDPHGALIERLERGDDHVRRLAEFYLARRGRSAGQPRERPESPAEDRGSEDGEERSEQ